MMSILIILSYLCHLVIASCPDTQGLTSGMNYNHLGNYYFLSGYQTTMSVNAPTSNNADCSCTGVIISDNAALFDSGTGTLSNGAYSWTIQSTTIAVATAVSGTLKLTYTWTEISTGSTWTYETIDIALIKPSSNDGIAGLCGPNGVNE